MSLESISRLNETGGVPVATDRIASKDYQLLKISLGAIGTDEGPVGSTNPMPVISSPILVPGNIISQGFIDAATIEGASLAGVIVVNYTIIPIKQLMIFNNLTSMTQLSVDGGSTWMTLFAEASPTIDWASKGLVIESDILIRKAPSITVTGDSICAWGII